ncbi:MAG TPA: CsbD family protein [Gammaproteobacteria bacterium]
MNWDMIAGQWKQLSGKARQRWGKLTDDDWEMIKGKRDELIGRIQARYGRSREDAEREVDEWSSGLH